MLSSQQPPDRTVWGHQSSVPDEGAGREHSKENLMDKKKNPKTKQMTLIYNFGKKPQSMCLCTSTKNINI